MSQENMERIEDTEQLMSMEEASRHLPLSFAQEPLWFLDRLGAGSAYHVTLAVKLTGVLSQPVLEKSLNEIVRRHESLRAVFPTVNGQPTQLIIPSPALSLSVMSLEEILEEDREAQALKLASNEARRPFDLSQGPLVRATLLRLCEKKHILLIVMPEIICDVWSRTILMKELATLYEAFSFGNPSPLAELPIQYTDLLRRERLQGKALTDDLAYWKQQLDGNIPLQLPADRPRTATQTFQGATSSLDLSSGLTEGLKELSRREGVTLFMTLLAAFQVILYRYTGQDDILVGSPVDGRDRTGADAMIGCLVNTLVMRSDLSGDPSFRELLQRVREVVLGAYAHQGLSFAKLVEELRPDRNPGNNPLFQVMFVSHRSTWSMISASDLRMIPVEVESKTAAFDLTLLMIERADGLTAVIEYNTDLFDAATITRMLQHLKTLLEAIVANPNRRISSLPMLTDAERSQLAIDWSSNHADYSTELCFHQLFEIQAERTPDNIAVVFEDEQVTYKELNRRANQVANHLISLGVGIETPVGIFAQQSVLAMVAILGLLKAGGTYVPLDSDEPKEYLARIIAETQVFIILTQGQFLDMLPEYRPHTICLDRDWNDFAQQSTENPYGEVSAENTCAIFFTSGSTGRPKGVMTPHRSPMSRLLWVQSIWQLTEADRFLLYDTMLYPSTMTQLFLPAVCGAQLVIGLPGRQDPAYFAKVIADNGITIVGFAPSVLREFLKEQGRFPNCLRHVFGSSEAMPLELQHLCLDTIDAELHKFYGLTEAPGVAYGHCRREDDYPYTTIGRPTDMRAYVLDSKLEVVPIGVLGQIYTGGVGLARGYLNRSDTTAERFIPDPFSSEPGARMYKTGDIARWSLDGNIEFHGRKDHQVNIRGFRIELGETEMALSLHTGVQRAAVIAREEKVGQIRLIAYFVANPGATVTGSELRDFLKDKLADNKIPSLYVRLDTMPLLSNGKVNRLALSAIGESGRDLEPEFMAPRTPIEQALAGIWADMLRVEQVGAHDNFFVLGGHSLLAVQMTFRVRDALQVEFPLRSLFESPTLAGMAENIERIRSIYAEQPPLVKG